MPARLPRSETTGMNMATIGVLFRNTDRLELASMMRSCAVRTLLTRANMRRVTSSIAPVRERPATTM